MAVLDTDYYTTPTNLTKGIIKFLEHVNEINWNGQYYDLDSCANQLNAKVPHNYITEEQNALITEWNGQRVWCNPPYSRGNVDNFVNRAVEQCKTSNKDVIMLLNVDVSTKWFKCILNNAKAIVYITSGRIKFVKTSENALKADPLKPSMFVLFSSTKKPNEFVRTYYCDLNLLQEAGNDNPR